MKAYGGIEVIAPLIVNLHTWRKWMVSLTLQWIYLRWKKPGIRKTEFRSVADADISFLSLHS